ncbi:MAG TPA: nucleotidyltransferase domain-containing protein [Stellaceae bacterium]|jgi:predicted nucleotidyltransferase|nr:nucleotidyltransferase domain-containing protein [Stellaceae bacterium]
MPRDRLDLPAAHRQVAIDIMRQHLPPDSTVWVFGSRAAGQARRYSDLDLAIDAGRRLTLDDTAALAEAFEESDLPYRVDIVDWLATSARFREIIAADRVLLVPDPMTD